MFKSTILHHFASFYINLHGIDMVSIELLFHHVFLGVFCAPWFTEGPVWVVDTGKGGSFTINHVLKIENNHGHGEVNTSDFMGCDASLLSDNQSIYNYLMFSGDADGVTITTSGTVNSYRAYCPDNFFWRSVSCRNDVTKCVLFVTGGDGWDTLPMLQRSAAYNMPIAFGVAASYGKYLSAPKEYTSLFLTCVKLAICSVFAGSRCCCKEYFPKRSETWRKP